MEKIDGDSAGFACPNVEKHLLYSFVGENGKNRKFYEFISEDSLGQLWYVDDGNEVPKRFLRHSQIFEQLFVLINTKEVFWNMQALKYR